MLLRYPLFLCLLGCFVALSAQPTLEFATVATNFSSPVDLAAPADGTDRLFVVERGGTVKIIDQLSDATNRAVLGTPFLSLGGSLSSGGERGLLGLAFHPNYVTNGFFYVNYTVSVNGQLTTRISRFARSANNPNQANATSELVLLAFAQPYGNHNGGDLAFGPDGYLYIATGDGGSGGDPQGLAQNRTNLLGNILRIDVDTPNAAAGTNYSIPTTNPYANNTNGFRPEIWSYGWRNPWRFSFDRQTGDMWVADVGQNQWEEVSFEVAGSAGGGNYGWKCKEGDNTFSAGACVSGATLTDPIFEYPHNNTTGGSSITGGFVYRGDDYPALNGYYIVADYASNNFWRIDANTQAASIQSGTGVSRVSTFGESNTGELYLAELSSGQIKRVFTNAVLPVELLHFTARAAERQVDLRWATATESQSSHFDIERSTDGLYFEAIGRQATAGNTTTERRYAYTDRNLPPGTYYYRLRHVDLDGSAQYGPVRRVTVAGETVLELRPNPSHNGQVFAHLPVRTDAPLTWALRDVSGRELLRMSGGADWRLHDLAPGVYFVTATADGQRYTQRLVVE